MARGLLYLLLRLHRTQREKFTVRLIKSIDLPLIEPTTSQPGLVAGIVALTDCLDGTASPETYGLAARNALAAAHAAERLIAEQKRRLLHFEQLAVTDELTGLLNRRGFEAEITRTMAGARRYQEKGVLLYIDLDGFKPVNDTHGHAAGDAVLRHVAKLLKDNVRETDFVGRLGGDEFAVLLTRTTWEAGLDRAEAFDRLVNAAGLDWQGYWIDIRASFGFQTYGPEDDLAEILNSADSAMYVTKRARAMHPHRDQRTAIA
ncbi:MAG: GGDEF domain-containing protein [Rhodospirillales bacterium]|nr:GGDEF domain-containing protein [Alphaproteobacteria bacterium]MBL6947438.1 GGDEF domain-containing protein [Rhodospirillales bacterium]